MGTLVAAEQGWFLGWVLAAGLDSHPAAEQGPHLAVLQAAEEEPKAAVSALAAEPAEVTAQVVPRDQRQGPKSAEE